MGKTFNVDTSDIFTIQNSLMKNTGNAGEESLKQMVKWENIKYDISTSNKDFDKLVVNIDNIEPINPPIEF